MSFVLIVLEVYLKQVQMPYNAEIAPPAKQKFMAHWDHLASSKVFDIDHQYENQQPAAPMFWMPKKIKSA